MGKFVVLWNIVGWRRGFYENRVLRVTFVTVGEQVTGEREDYMIMSFCICSHNQNVFG